MPINIISNLYLEFERQRQRWPVEMVNNENKFDDERNIFQNYFEVSVYKTNDNITHNLHEICKNKISHVTHNLSVSQTNVAVRANVVSIEAMLLNDNLTWNALYLYLWIKIIVCSSLWAEVGKNGKPYTVSYHDLFTYDTNVTQLIFGLSSCYCWNVHTYKKISILPYCANRGEPFIRLQTFAQLHIP